MLEADGEVVVQAEGKERKKGKEEKREKKKNKRSVIQEGDSVGLEIVALEPANGAAAPRKGRGKEVLLSSIAAFLESNGFSRTLATFRSEAKVEVDSWTSSPVNLDDLFCRFLDESNVPVVANIDWQEELDKADKAREETARKNVNDAPGDTRKEKRNQSRGAANVAETKATNPPIEILSSENVHTANEPADKLKIKTKEQNSGASKDTEDENKEKKRKWKNNLSPENAEIDQRPPPVEGENADQELSSKFHENDKKKKSKKQSLVGNSSNDKFKEIVNGRIEELKLLVNESSESAEKNKGDKKKKRKLTENAEETDKNLTEKTVVDNNGCQYKEEKTNNGKSSSENIDAMILEKADAHTEVKPLKFSENVDISEKKISKKRKKLAAEENDSKTNNKTAVMDSDKVELDNGKNFSAKKRKMELTNIINGAPAENNLTAHDLSKKEEKRVLENGHPENNNSEGSALSKASKKGKSSSEPKTANAFQRVKVDAVEFADNRLQDNSYWAKDGADSGYGAKAQEVLGQVRGRGFRHEKTKKKRGSYRGGQIDLHSHSVKFNYSDEE